MRRRLVTAAVVVFLGGCNFFGGNIDAPTGFQGWFHVERPGRATSLAFESSNIAEVRDLGCDGVLNGETPWTADGDALVLAQWSGSPRFTQDPSTQGALVANPGMYGPSQERWLPGATCLVCPAGDAGVAVACDDPVVRDGGT
ncbi:MAG TPA: hypothetical protein VFD38_19530 [Myxococcaceae bacterium]|nr:hypothetical protein [Myxococcaceae bacterium]